MIPWTALAEWGQRAAVVTGLATPIYGGLAYFQLTPVTQSYVVEQFSSVRKAISAARVETLETKRVVFGLARSDLVRERQALEGALKAETNPATTDVWRRRIENITTEIVVIDRKAAQLDDRIEGMKTDE